jgi:hypothetical protein
LLKMARKGSDCVIEQSMGAHGGSSHLSDRISSICGKFHFLHRLNIELLHSSLHDVRAALRLQLRASLNNIPFRAVPPVVGVCGL